MVLPECSWQLLMFARNEEDMLRSGFKITSEWSQNNNFIIRLLLEGCFIVRTSTEWWMLTVHVVTLSSGAGAEESTGDGAQDPGGQPGQAQTGVPAVSGDHARTHWFGRLVLCFCSGHTLYFDNGGSFSKSWWWHKNNKVKLGCSLNYSWLFVAWLTDTVHFDITPSHSSRTWSKSAITGGHLGEHPGQGGGVGGAAVQRPSGALHPGAGRQQPGMCSDLQPPHPHPHPPTPVCWAWGIVCLHPFISTVNPQ